MFPCLHVLVLLAKGGLIYVIDLDLESQVLAAMLNNDDCLNTGLDQLQGDDFSDRFYRYIFTAMHDMYGKNEAVNYVTVYERVKAQAKGKGTTWMILRDAYLPTPAETFAVYTDKLKGLTKSRRLMELAQSIIDNVNNGADADGLCEQVEGKLFAITSEKAADVIVTPQEQAETIAEILAAQMDEESRKKSCIYTSYGLLNRKIGGFESGDLVIISGPTGGGKTAFTMNLIRDIAITQKLPALHINTEMSRKQMAIRWASILAKDPMMNNATIRAGNFSQDQLTQFMGGDIEKMNSSGLHGITIPDLTVPKMMSTIRRFAMQKQIRCAAVDYIGRVDTMNSNKDDWKQILSAAKKLKTIGQQHDLVTFMVAQNSKDGSLAMASYIEHEADLHLHIRPMTEKEEEEYRYKKMQPWWNYMLVIRKGRSAPTGSIPVRFAKEKQVFIMDEQEAIANAKMADELQKQGKNTATYGHS